MTDELVVSQPIHSLLKANWYKRVFPKSVKPVRGELVEGRAGRDAAQSERVIVTFGYFQEHFGNTLSAWGMGRSGEAS